VELWSIDQTHAQGIMTVFNVKQMSELGICESMTNYAVLALREQTIAPKLHLSMG